MKNRHMSYKIDILKLIRNNSFNGRDISRKVGVNRQTTYVILQDMVKENLLCAKKDGRNILYSLSNTYNLNQYLVLSENYISLHIPKELRPLIMDLNGLYDTMIIFGSFASGTQHNDSDVDVMFVGKVSDAVKDIFTIFPREVNFQKVTWKEFATLKTALWYEIKKTHLIFGNVAKVLDIWRVAG